MIWIYVYWCRLYKYTYHYDVSRVYNQRKCSDGPIILARTCKQISRRQQNTNRGRKVARKETVTTYLTF